MQESCLCVPLDRRLPRLRLRSTNLRRLVGQRFVVRMDSWDASSSYPSCHLLRVLGPLNELRWVESASKDLKHSSHNNDRQASPELLWIQCFDRPAINSVIRLHNTDIEIH